MDTTKACLKQACSCAMHRDSLKSKVTGGASWCAQVFKQTVGDVIRSCCTIGINGFKQPLDFCYGHTADCNKRTAGSSGIGQGLRSEFSTFQCSRGLSLIESKRCR